VGTPLLRSSFVRPVAPADACQGTHPNTRTTRPASRRDTLSHEVDQQGVIVRPVPWLTRVRVSNYKSLADVDVRLDALTILIGPNGSGKSNFLDAIRFLGDAIATSPYQAAESRGGLSELLTKSDTATSPKTITIGIDAVVPWGPAPDQWAKGAYQIRLALHRRTGRRPIEVVSEICTIAWKDTTEEFSVHGGEIHAPGVRLPAQKIEPDRLLLPLVGTFGNFAPLVRALETMAFYHLEPRVMRQPEPEAEATVLGAYGEHLGDVLGEMAAEDPSMKRRVDEYLSVVVPGLISVDRDYAGNYVTLAMRQEAGNKELGFHADAMSDGTIRAAGVLAALFQPSVLHGGTSLVGIEEPELALHPAAAGVLFDALTEASERVQVIATSQSADLLDRDDIEPAAIRAVRYDAGRTEIGDLDDASVRILANRRSTLGELMRGNQLDPKRVA
jgi:predicted ATPase